jgi:hypothetical protein
MTNDFDPTLTDRFAASQIKPGDFGHRDHLQVAFELLNRHDFLESCAIYGRTIDRMAKSVGAPEKYNATITIAFLSLIAERREGMTQTDIAAFLDANPDLLDKDVLAAWYSRERLTSAQARAQFLMPDRVLVT